MTVGEVKKIYPNALVLSEDTGHRRAYDSITDPEGRELPFYFEMWFSFSTQHAEKAIVFDPSR